MLKLGPLVPLDSVVWNGVTISDLNHRPTRDDRFCRQFGWPSDCFVVGLTGQMAPTKGHEDFIEAAAIVAQTNTQVRFVIGGKSTEPFFSEIQRLIVARGLEGIVEFCGWLETSRQFFESIDLFVLASRHDEGFGLVLAEAGERGLASVATRSGGASEIVIDGETGILIEKSDPTQMAEAIKRLVDHKNMRDEMGMCARRRITEYFDLARQSQKMEEVITVP
jgi:glycosyltransferase involved in cell wall biosynthesis